MTDGNPGIPGRIRRGAGKLRRRVRSLLGLEPGPHAGREASARTAPDVDTDEGMSAMEARCARVEDGLDSVLSELARLRAAVEQLREQVLVTSVLTRNEHFELEERVDIVLDELLRVSSGLRGAVESPPSAETPPARESD